MEALVTGVAVQALALALLALLALGGDAGTAVLVKLREDGRTDYETDQCPDRLRQLAVRCLLGMFAGGTLLALVGLPRL